MPNTHFPITDAQQRRWQCPKCGQSLAFMVNAEFFVSRSPHAAASCGDCGWYGIVADLNPQKQPEKED